MSPLRCIMKLPNYQEEKTMKKFIALLMLACTLLVFAACNMTECDFCGEKKNCETEEVFGKEINYCKDCEEDLEDISNGIGDLFD